METRNVFPRLESTASSKLGKNGAAAPEAEAAYQRNVGTRKRKQRPFTSKVRSSYFTDLNCNIYNFSLSTFSVWYLVYTIEVRKILFVAEWWSTYWFSFKWFPKNKGVQFLTIAARLIYYLTLLSFLNEVSICYFFNWDELETELLNLDWKGQFLGDFNLKLNKLNACKIQRLWLKFVVIRTVLNVRLNIRI